MPKLGWEREENRKYIYPFFKNKKVAFCGNQTSLIGKNTFGGYVYGNLMFNWLKFFCPEHGFRGEAEAGAIISSSLDPKTGLPIVSLYGKNKKPTPAQLEGVDIIVFDIQDVGCRFYTYISTLHYVMEAAAECEVEVLILDRPNPNGYYVAGPVLDTQYASFVGMHQVPIVHGMTMAEYGRMINDEGWLKNGIHCQLSWIPMEDYTHLMRYSLPVAPSPNLRTNEAINLYPPLCLFEGTAISIGRGTEIPFQVFGAPDLQLGDFYFTPEPIKGVSESSDKGETCRGVNLTDSAVINMKSIQNDFTLVYLIQAYAHFLDKNKFFNRPDFFDKLMGNSIVREMIMIGATEQEIVLSWQSKLDKFKKVRKQYLLYPDFE